MNTKIALILGALAGIGFSTPMAAPQAEPAAAPPGTFHTYVDGPTAQANTNLFVCTDAGFKGRNQNLATTKGVCYNLGNGFNDAISSLGPDKGTTCTIYDNSGCSGASVGGIQNPGINDLSDYGFNDRASSYRCV
ncbi:MAG: hypothetical protein Q9166_006318 [cf. Caloplaca sp. 2 TL-2023]